MSTREAVSPERAAAVLPLAALIGALAVQPDVLVPSSRVEE